MVLTFVSPPQSRWRLLRSLTNDSNKKIAERGIGMLSKIYMELGFLLKKRGSMGPVYFHLKYLKYCAGFQQNRL